MLASIHDAQPSTDRRHRLTRIADLAAQHLLSDSNQQIAVLATAPDAAVRAHITDALRHVVTIRFAARLADLAVIRAVVRPVAALLYLDGSYDRIEPAKWIAQLQALRATCASLPIIGYAPLTGPAFEQGMLASRAGVNEIALHGRDLLCDSVARLVGAAATQGAGRVLLPHVLAVAPALSGDTLRIVQYCIDRATEALTVGRLSTGVGLSRRTLAYRLSRTALPAPEQLIMWCRLLVVACLLQEPRCTVNHAARTLNCRGPSSLRSLTMSYLGCPPRDLKEPGAIARVAAAMVASGTRSLRD